MKLISKEVPRPVAAAVELALAARGQEDWLLRVVANSPVPIALVDDERRHVEVNGPARLLFRLSLDEMRRLGIEDMTPPEDLHVMESAWSRLLANRCVAGPYEISAPDNSRFDVVYCALAEILPGLHLIASAPAAWPDDELAQLPAKVIVPPHAPLTARELEVLRLAAGGRSGPQIAQELVVSLGTVRKHFDNLYEKLAVSGRPAAVTKALRLGLID